MTKILKERWQKLAGILKEQKLGDVSPESMDPAREEEEAFNRQLGDYPETASEYAKQLNSRKSGSGFRLADDSEHWDKSGVKTGEDLARYLAIADHRDSFKETYGTRPRHMNYDEMSIEEIEAATQRLLDGAGNEFWDDADPWEGEVEIVDEAEPRDEGGDELDKYADIESEWDEKLNR